MTLNVEPGMGLDAMSQMNSLMMKWHPSESLLLKRTKAKATMPPNSPLGEEDEPKLPPLLPTRQLLLFLREGKQIPGLRTLVKTLTANSQLLELSNGVPDLVTPHEVPAQP